MAHNHGATGHAAHTKHRKARCETYRASGRRDVNKALKLMRHMRRFGEQDDVMDIYRGLPLNARMVADKTLAHQRAMGAGGR